MLLAEGMPQATVAHNPTATVHAFQFGAECGAPPLQHQHFQIGQGKPSLWSEVENAAMAAEPSKEPPSFSSPPTPSPDNFVFNTLSISSNSIGGKSMVEMQLNGGREPPTAIQNADGVCFDKNTHSLLDTDMKYATCEQYELATKVLIDLGVNLYYTHALSTLNEIPHLVDSESVIGSAGGAPGYLHLLLIASLLGLGLVLLRRRGRAVLGCRPLLGILTLAIPLCWGSHDSVTTTDGTTCLTITDDVFRGGYREIPNGCAIITAGCNELEEKAFRRSNLRTMTIEYSTTPLKIGEDAFEKLRHDDELTLIKTCETGCGDCSSVRCNGYDDECTGTCTCTTRALTLDRGAFQGLIVTFEAACNSYPLSPPSPPSPPPPPPSPPSPPPSPPSPPLQPGARYASSSWELIAALGDDSIDRVLLPPGTYEFTGDMCSQSAICINRNVTIEAEVPGGVVLDAKSGRRVFFIQYGGTAELVGLNITGGFIADANYNDGGGLYIESGGVANLKGCNIYQNTAARTGSGRAGESRGGGLRVKGVANLEGCNIHSNSAKDGGGVLVDRGGEATLVNTNVYANAAETVCWLSNLSSIFKPAHRPTYSSLPMIPLHCLNS